MNEDRRLTLRGVKEAIETYAPDFMHGLPKKDYVKFLELFNPSTQCPEVEGSAGLAYCMFQHLLALDNSKYWSQFLEEALNEVISDRERKTEGV